MNGSLCRSVCGFIVQVCVCSFTVYGSLRKSVCGLTVNGSLCRCVCVVLLSMIHYAGIVRVHCERFTVQVCVRFHCAGVCVCGFTVRGSLRKSVCGFTVNGSLCRCVCVWF